MQHAHERSGYQIVDETHRKGRGFLAEVAGDWEAATEPAAKAGVRVVLLRLGMVLSDSGGALGKMLAPFRWGLADVLGIVGKIIDDPNISGPVNAVSPQAVTNREFTKTLGRLLGRPTVARMPALRPGFSSERWPMNCSCMASARRQLSLPKRATSFSIPNSKGRCGTSLTSSHSDGRKKKAWRRGQTLRGAFQTGWESPDRICLSGYH